MGAGDPVVRGGWAETPAEVERRHIVETLRRTGGTIAGPNGAAVLLGLPRTTLQHRMRKLGVAPSAGGKLGA